MCLLLVLPPNSGLDNLDKLLACFLTCLIIWHLCVSWLIWLCCSDVAMLPDLSNELGDCVTITKKKDGKATNIRPCGSKQIKGGGAGLPYWPSVRKRLHLWSLLKEVVPKFMWLHAVYCSTQHIFIYDDWRDNVRERVCATYFAWVLIVL